MKFDECHPEFVRVFVMRIDNHCSGMHRNPRGAVPDGQSKSANVMATGLSLTAGLLVHEHVHGTDAHPVVTVRAREGARALLVRVTARLARRDRR